MAHHFLPRILLVASAALAAVALPAQAQLLSSLKVEPAAIKAGESTTATVNVDVLSGINCGVRLHWGDGTTTDHKINQPKDVPLVASHTYAKAGNYAVMAEPKTIGASMKCGGKNQNATVAVAPLPVLATAKVAAAPAPKAASAASPCPAGWKLAKAGVAKNGAFTCTAPANTKLPEARLACPGDLGYFENGKKGQLGCRT